jgi:prefoldin beta subunit
MSTSIPPQFQEQLAKLQQLQQTLQIVLTQKQQLELELSDAERSLTELEKLTDTAVIYKSIGSLLVKSDRPNVIKELTERKELLKTRVAVLAKQEERTRERLNELSQSIQERLKQSPEYKPSE